MKKIFFTVFTIVMIMGLAGCNKETEDDNLKKIVSEIETIKIEDVVEEVSLISVYEIEVENNADDIVNAAINEFMDKYDKEKRYSCVYYGGTDVTDVVIEYVNEYSEYLIEQGYEEISSPFVGNVETYVKDKDIVTIEILYTQDKETLQEKCALIVEYYK